MMPTPVLLPARRFEVEVVLGAHDGLSLIEQYILRAIALGDRTVESISDILALPERMVLDALVDLLSREFVEVRADGVLALNDRVRQAMGDPSLPNQDWFLSFQSTQVPEPRSVRLVQDLVAGQVFSYPRVPNDRERLPRMPYTNMAPDISEIPLGTLVEAVTRAVRDSAQNSAGPKGDLYDAPLPRDARVLSVRLARSATGGIPRSAGSSYWIPVELLMTNRGSEEPPRIVLVAPTRIPLHVRRSIATALEDLWSRGFGRGKDQFFERLPVTSEPQDLVPEPRFTSVATVADRMEAVVQSAAKAPTIAHNELTSIWQNAGDTTERLAAYASPSTALVGSASTFKDSAIEALRTANHQVVLVCPWIGRIARDSVWEEALRDASSRLIKVILIWGIDPELRNEEAPEWQTLHSLAEEGAVIVAARRGARSHAKLVVCDTAWAVATSCNYLNASPDHRRREVGIRVACSDGIVPLALQTMLGWARRLIPDHVARDQCIDTPELFGLRQARPALRVAVEELEAPNLDFGTLGVDAWRRAWQTRIMELRQLFGPSGTITMPVFDGDHRDLLVRAIEQAQQRLMIESHRVSPYGLTEFVVHALQTALERGVRVVLRHGTDEALDPGVQARLKELVVAGATVTATDTHAKVLLHDDWAVVSSFNFLSADPGLRGARELGVQTNDMSVVDTLWHSTADK